MLLTIVGIYRRRALLDEIAAGPIVILDGRASASSLAQAGHRTAGPGR